MNILMFIYIFKFKIILKMEINNEKMKHLRIEHLPNNIAWLRQQIQEHNTQLDDLCKVRVALEAKADPSKSIDCSILCCILTLKVYILT